MNITEVRSSDNLMEVTKKTNMDTGIAVEIHRQMDKLNELSLLPRAIIIGVDTYERFIFSQDTLRGTGFLQPGGLSSPMLTRVFNLPLYLIPLPEYLEVVPLAGEAFMRRSEIWDIDIKR